MVEDMDGLRLALATRLPVMSLRTLMYVAAEDESGADASGCNGERCTWEEAEDADDHSSRLMCEDALEQVFLEMPTPYSVASELIAYSEVTAKTSWTTAYLAHRRERVLVLTLDNGTP